MTPSCSSISYFPSAQTRNSRNGPTATFPEDSIPAHAGKTTPTRRPWCGSSAHPRSRGENHGLSPGKSARLGSSPLTRGKRVASSGFGGEVGLIPAHAGKTAGVRRADQGDGAHPRSRGENAILLGVPFTTAGSSPLTRGKPSSRCAAPLTVGLIPAHAGKTDRAWRRGVHPQAHPRSRGENFTCLATTVVSSGSSPLTRGKPRQDVPGRADRGLIPAHAGKTAHSTHSTCAAWAHPRSRGENSEKTAGGAGNRGSSPLTRGKQRPQLRRRLRQRLIPAHAGKTSAPPGLTSSRPAHPRSRGENKDTRSGLWESMGSSPLTRGKPLVFGDLLGNERLIPAHAGKTTWTTPCSRPTAAHPRSRGENGDPATIAISGGGSSPLTRGKQSACKTGMCRSGLIPAHAGKTGARRSSPSARAAHPRSRGENGPESAGKRHGAGSSPLTRGKLASAERRRGGERLIPAHAGKTLEERPSSVRESAHPRSRGENTWRSRSRIGTCGSSPLTRGKRR